jgi:hypothetical protein
VNYIPYSPYNGYQAAPAYQPPVNAQPAPQAQQQPAIMCRPVASEEEARATPTPFDGSTLILTDFGHGRIYSKALNYNDGSAVFRTYQLAPARQEAQVEYAPMAALMEVKDQLDALKKELEKRPAQRKGATAE